MHNVDDLNELTKQVGMFFDQALDPQSRAAFLQRVSSDPVYQQAYQHEQLIRENLKKLIHRPGDPSQLIQAIRNQIGQSEK
jgi:hypothetical protein